MDFHSLGKKWLMTGTFMCVCVCVCVHIFMCKLDSKRKLVREEYIKIKNGR